MPVILLTDDLLAHVFEHLDLHHLLTMGAVCRQWLNAVSLCNAWRGVEKQRLKHPAAYLRGVFLRVELEISMRTGAAHTPPVTVVLSRMPMWRFYAGMKIKGDGKVYAGCDDVRHDWDFARPAGVPPPRLGAQGYVARLKRADLWQQQRRYTLCGTEDKCKPLFLDFSAFELMSGANVSDAKGTTTPDTTDVEHYYNLFQKTLVDEHISDALFKKFDSDCHFSAEELEELRDDFSISNVNYCESAWCTPWIEFGLHYDLEDDTFGLRFGMGSDDHNFGEQNESDYVYAVMALLGHAPSLTALLPNARRRQAAALRAWLQQSA